MIVSVTPLHSWMLFEEHGPDSRAYNSLSGNGETVEIDGVERIAAIMAGATRGRKIEWKWLLI